MAWHLLQHLGARLRLDGHRRREGVHSGVRRVQMGLVDERVAAVGDGALGGLESSLDRFHEALRATEESVLGQVSSSVLVHELGDTRTGEPSA